MRIVGVIDGQTLQAMWQQRSSTSVGRRVFSLKTEASADGGFSTWCLASSVVCPSLDLLCGSGSGRQLSWEGASQRLGSVLGITVRDLKYLILDIFSHLWSQGWSKNKLKPRQSWLGGSHDHFGYAALLGSGNNKRFHKVRKSCFIEKEFTYNWAHSLKIARPSCKISSLAKQKQKDPWHHASVQFLEK